MKKYKPLIIMLLFLCTLCSAQPAYEREHRIRKAQFPSISDSIIPKNAKIKQARYYREKDSTMVVYTRKFKMDRLQYFLDYDEKGKLLNLGFRVKEIDIPTESFSLIKTYLNKHFKNYRIRQIVQAYPITTHEGIQKRAREAFQNLILPGIRYQLKIRGQKEGGWGEYEIHFNSNGGFKMLRRLPPANYDHVLY